MRLICKIMWNLSELFGINLGKSAPYVFGGMIGSKPIKSNVMEIAEFLDVNPLDIIKNKK